MNCPKCDTQLPDDALFCIECGASIERAATGPTQRIAPAATGPRCPACQTQNPSEAIFCVQCGRTLSAGAPVAEAPKKQVPSGAPPLSVGPLNLEKPPAPPQRPAPAVPAFVGVGRGSHRGFGKHLDGVAGGVFMIGLALLFVTGKFWPGILLLLGVTGMISSIGRGRPAEGVQALLWMGGMALLFAFGWVWPGILVLIGISALLGGGCRKWS